MKLQASRDGYKEIEQELKIELGKSQKIELALEPVEKKATFAVTVVGKKQARSPRRSLSAGPGRARPPRPEGREGPGEGRAARRAILGERQRRRLPRAERATCR